MSELAISAEHLSKTYRDGWIRRRSFPALADLQLQVPRGEVFGLLGPNGAGKTTFIKILLGIIRRSSGEAQVFGQPAGSPEARRLIGYLPEQMRVPRHLTGKTALEYYGSLSGLSLATIRSRTPELLETVGLAQRGQDLTRKYSKGMVQRLGLAQALLHRPPLLILDEPTDGLDPKARAEMRQVLTRLKQDGVTIFLNSHILQEVEMVCDHVAILHQGRLRYSGSVAEIGGWLGRSDAANQTRMKVQLGILGDAARLRELSQTWHDCQIEAGEELRVLCTVGDQAELDGIVDQIRAAGMSLSHLERQRVSLEDAFLSIIAGDTPAEATYAAGADS